MADIVPDGRRSLLAQIHIARKELGLPDEGYRDVLRRVAGCESSQGCSIGQLTDLVAEFRRLGWKGGHKRRPLSPHAHVRMVYAIWKNLRPHLRSGGTDAALRAYVRRQTVTAVRPEGVSAPEFLTAEDARPVIEGLKKWLARERGA